MSGKFPEWKNETKGNNSYKRSFKIIFIKKVVSFLAINNFLKVKLQMYNDIVMTLLFAAFDFALQIYNVRKKLMIF